MPTMRLVGDSVPMLINGVSQQSEIIRLPTQVSEQINCTSSIVQGLTKRPPTEFLKQLVGSQNWSNAKVHFISRDENEKYIVVVQDKKIQIFDMDGNEHAVAMNTNDGYITLDSDADAYPTPLTAFRLYTVADTTFVVNRNVKVLMDESSSSPSEKPYRALVWIKSAKTDKLHNISIMSPDQASTGEDLNISVSYKPSADAAINLNHSAQMLARDLGIALDAKSVTSSVKGKGWKVGTHTNIVYIESAENDFAIHASNDWSDTYISVIKDTVGGVAELPSRGFPGMRIKVTGNVEDSEQGFWVKFLPDDEALQDLGNDTEAGDEVSDGMNTVTFAPGDVDISDNTILIENHHFLGKPKSGNATVPVATTGGEREMVQYLEGSFTVGGLADKKFYFVDALRAGTTGLPTGYIKLSKHPSANITDAETVEDVPTPIDLTTLGGTQVSTQTLATTTTQPTISDGILTLTLDGTPLWSVGDEVEVNDVSSSSGSIDPSGVFVLTAVGSSTISYAVEGSALPWTIVGGSVTGRLSNYKDARLVRVRVLKGKWVESIAPSTDNESLLTEFDTDTMPHFLVRTSEVDNDGRYKFSFLGGTLDNRFPLLKWGSRIVGDKDSAPDPTFVGNTINDVFEWRQSLGFASGQNFILSERSQYLNFWPITVATSLEDARIDVAGSGSNMSDFHSIRVFQDELVGFTNEGQFTLTATGTTLTPETVSLAQTTKYESSETGQPINIGSSIAFPTSRGNFSAISEYFIREDQMAYVNENTRHVSHYIAGDVIHMSVSPVSDSLVVQTDADPKTLYFYQWYWQGNEKVQSSWSKWTFGSDIISADFVKDVLYLIMQGSTGTPYPELYKLILTAGDTDIGGSYKTSLDRRVLFPAHASATITLPYNIESGTMRVVDSDGRVLTIASQSTNTITLSEPVDSKDIYVGEIYDSQVEFTRPVMRSRYKENVDLKARLQIQDYTLYHENTGYFKAQVYPKSYTETPYEYEMDNLLGGTTLGTPSIDSRSFKVPVRANAREMRLIVRNDSHFPHHLVSAEWSASYNPKIYRQ